MISLERIRQGAKQAAELILANEEAERVASEEGWARERVEQQARFAAFEQQKPRLQEKARALHQVRFQPLQEILDQLAEPVRSIRDEYFSGSPVFVVDHYEGHCSEGPERYYDNLYYRAMMVLDRNAIPGTTQRLLGVYAMAEEPSERKFIKFGSYKDTRYNVGIGLHYIHTDILHSRERVYMGRFLQLATGVREDMEYVTSEADLFNVASANEGGRISFASHYGTTPSLRYIKYDLGEPIRFRQADPRTFTAIEARFTDVLRSRELEVLMAAKEAAR